MSGYHFSYLLFRENAGNFPMHGAPCCFCAKYGCTQLDSFVPGSWSLIILFKTRFSIKPYFKSVNSFENIIGFITMKLTREHTNNNYMSLWAKATYVGIGQNQNRSATKIVSIFVIWIYFCQLLLPFVEEL